MTPWFTARLQSFTVSLVFGQLDTSVVGLMTLQCNNYMDLRKFHNKNVLYKIQ